MSKEWTYIRDGDWEEKKLGGWANPPRAFIGIRNPKMLCAV